MVKKNNVDVILPADENENLEEDKKDSPVEDSPEKTSEIKEEEDMAKAKKSKRKSTKKNGGFFANWSDRRKAKKEKSLVAKPKI